MSEWIEEILIGTGIVGGWVGTVFGFARKHGRLEHRVNTNTTDIEEIKRMFKTADGEPRLLSFSAHESICSERQKLMHTEFKHMRDTMERIETKFDAYIKKNGGSK
jgi:hypothetical protein